MKSFAFASTLPASFLAEMSGAALAVRYGWYFLLVALGLFFIALTGRRAARGATREVVLEKCRALVKALDGAPAAPEKKKGGIAVQARTAKLRKAAEEAMWRASRLVDERKDLVFDPIAAELDEIADLLAAGEAGTAEDAEAAVKEASERAKAVLKKAEAAMSAEKGAEEAPKKG